MRSSQDPFDESVEDLRELVARGKCIQESVRLKGLIDRSVLVEVIDILEAAAEEVELLNNILQVIDQKNGKVGGRVFSVNEVLQRQRIVRDLNLELKGIHEFRNAIESRLEEMESKTRTVNALSNINQSDNDKFMLAQEVSQQEERAQQDILLDRLTYGLQELRETGVNINDEFDTQEVLLEGAERDFEGVQARLRVANAKVDKLLASMSDKGKICTIVWLTVILVFLAFFALG